MIFLLGNGDWFRHLTTILYHFRHIQIFDMVLVLQQNITLIDIKVSENCIRMVMGVKCFVGFYFDLSGLLFTTHTCTQL